MRAGVIRGFLAVLLGTLLAGLFNLQLFQGADYRDLSEKNCVRVLPQEGARGRIMDSRGEVLVDSVLTYDVLVMPQKKKEQLWQVLGGISGVIDVPVDEMARKFKRNFIASSIPVVVVRNIPTRKAIALEEKKSDIEGVMVQLHPVRNYPNGRLASHLIGYLSEIDHWRLTKLAEYGYQTKDIVGYTGLEERYDYYLRQGEGGLSMQVDHRGRFMRMLGYKAPANGKDVQLTLDARIQKIAEDALGEKNGAVILMDPSTGEIVAMASGPGYEPGAFVQKTGDSVSSYFTNPNAPLFNRAIGGVYPAASVFKAVVAACALETGKIDNRTTFFCNGFLQFGDRRFGCWETHHEQNLYDALAHSCDVFFYRTGLLVGANAISEYAQKFGFGRPTGVDLPYESIGSVPSPAWKRKVRHATWYDGDTLNFSIGQGDLLVTPLQVARMMAVFANDGSLVSPYLVKSVGGRDVSAGKRRSAKVGLKKSTLDEIRAGLRRVTEDGTGRALEGLGVAVAGKTGTAQVPHGLSHGWFAGYMPYDNPKYVMCVFLEHGGSGSAACQVTRQIIEAMVQQKII